MQGWSELRPVQSEAIEALLGGNDDAIIAAATAGGKTEAAFLPLLSEILNLEVSRDAGFDLVYIAPLKALINDQQRRLESLCLETELAVTPWHGDVAVSVKAKAIKRPRGVLLITPESLEALFIRRGQTIPQLFGGVRAVVIDELHTLLDTERGVHLRSLLARLELAVGRSIRRVGLSATLGDMNLARAYLRPGAEEGVTVVKADGGNAELQLQLRGYLKGGSEDDAAEKAVAAHLFEKLRGRDNLVFAGSRGSVEVYADRLRRMTEEMHLPQEFYPHHASLSKEHREFVEQRLKDDRLPTTAVCTSTLELGIDIGDVACVAQIGPPFTVAALRQRLGRSGRRAGHPAILRQYAIEEATDHQSALVDRLKLSLVRSVAMIELLLEGWCEPPKAQSLHLSTLVHQILSVIAERGGASARRLFVTLCEKGPFSAVTPDLFARVLRQLGHPDVSLIEQSEDGSILLGKVGEKLVEHYSFYAVFMTPEEYRILAEGRDLGTLPVDDVLAPGMTIIFSGRRWEVIEVDDLEKVISVRQSHAGVAPLFGGDPGDIHDEVIDRMRVLFTDDQLPIYLDDTAGELLTDARTAFARSELGKKRIIDTGDNSALLATWCGTAKTWSLGLAFGAEGFKWSVYDGFLEIDGRDTKREVRDVLDFLGAGGTIDLSDQATALSFEKFHPYLSRDLLLADAKSSRLNLGALPPLAGEILNSI
ncbi:ATP-dependent helicase [Parvularcula bermudensis HTCC2503]|uniref:ATP-dependent helicase n=1 Tax=Parvularcula bermudensis (strain ATCC BAA-594 / HTCC2503 / KCTC 12087) TaxID=314260 RepID=E0TAZ0_PARBH|nr:ATP-dependent helicase [Parvularcula bermudensis HTCC2503]